MSRMRAMGGPGRRASANSTLLELTDELSARVSALRFTGAVDTIYNPLDYAGASHREYLERFGGRRGVAILLGMNPGPWGMAQTGIPFGEVGVVRDWLKIKAPIGKPQRDAVRTHRPVFWHFT